MGNAQEVECDAVAGCDGFHGACRPSISDSAVAVYEREYPFAWLGVLARTPPYTASSRAAATSLAENYVGLPFG